MLLSLLKLTSLKTKCTIAMVIKSDINIFVCLHKLFELFISQGLTMVSEDVFEKPVASLSLLFKFRLLYDYFFLALHVYLAQLKDINFSAY